MSTINIFFQPLESRTLLSASVGESNSQLEADKQQLALDIQQYKTDANTMVTTLQADRAKVADDLKAICDSKKAARQQLAADTKAMIEALRADSQAGKPVYEKWKPVIDADKAAMKSDGEHSDQFATDKAKLEADYKAFRDEMAPIEAHTHADIAHWSDVLKADKAALATGGDDSLCQQLKSDKDKLKSDETYFKGVLKDDYKKISEDCARIRKDGGGDHKGGETKKPTTKK